MQKPFDGVPEPQRDRVGDLAAVVSSLDVRVEALERKVEWLTRAMEHQIRLTRKIGGVDDAVG
jgi:hypothetical protein